MLFVAKFDEGKYYKLSLFNLQKIDQLADCFVFAIVVDYFAAAAVVVVVAAANVVDVVEFDFVLNFEQFADVEANAARFAVDLVVFAQRFRFDADN